MKNLNINPLFLLLMSLFVLLISVYSLNNTNKKLSDTQNRFMAYKKMAIKYDVLKKSWSNIKTQKIIIDKLISSSKVNMANVDFKNNKIKVKISNISTKDLNKFVNKLLNKKLNITKFYLNKNSLEFEVAQ